MRELVLDVLTGIAGAPPATHSLFTERVGCRLRLPHMFK